jgi:hypothetical protein
MDALQINKETPIPKEHPVWNTFHSLNDHFPFDNAFIQFFSGNQMEADVEGVWINGRGYIVFILSCFWRLKNVVYGSIFFI